MIKPVGDILIQLVHVISGNSYFLILYSTSLLFTKSKIIKIISLLEQVIISILFFVLFVSSSLPLFSQILYVQSLISLNISFDCSFIYTLEKSSLL